MEERVQVGVPVQQDHITGEVDIRPLKRLAAKLLPEDSTFRSVIVVESDAMSGVDYVAKLGTWLSILDRERERA